MASGSQRWIITTLCVSFAMVATIALFMPSIVMADGVKIKAQLDNHPFMLEVAQTPQAIERGLMGRTHVPPYYGMMFKFDGNDYRHFWMKNTLLPLDMLFINRTGPSRGRITQIIAGAMPCEHDPCPVYSSQERVAWVIELAGGRARALGLQSGDEVVLYPQ